MERAGGNSGAAAAGVPAAGEGAAAAAPTTVAGPGLVKSCKGSLFYSSVLRSEGRGPICVGVSRSLTHVPDREVREIELGTIQEGRHLSNFIYSCGGYSVYLDNKNNPPGKGEKHAQLPSCTGFEILKTEHWLNKDQAAAHIKKEATQAQANKPGHASARANKPGQKGDGFLTKFQRSAGLVANGVARNMNRVGTYVKDSVDDVLYRYRKRPK